MPNSIDLVTRFVEMIDEIYKQESKTAILDAITDPTAPGLNENEIKVMKVGVTGLGNYSRVTGYPAGNITAEWETLQLAIERGRAFTLDRMDNLESLGLLLGNVQRIWMREYVAPEMDATRFANYAADAGLTVAGATLSSGTVLAAIDAAVLAMNEAEVPEEGRVLFASYTVKQYIEQAISRVLENQNEADKRLKMLNGLPIVGVPQSRFYTAITLNPGATADAGGYIKDASTGKDINFMIIHPSAVLQPVKLNNVKYFSPEVNQQTDGHLWQYRLYHDALTYENKVNGIYLHKKA
jgi:hypothetical protein